MTFGDSISTCLKKYFVFKGRASKYEFWFFALFLIIYFFVIGFLLGMAGVSDEGIETAGVLLVLPVLCPYIAVTARRLHDFNHSGWMQLVFVPGYFADEFIGTGWIIYTVTVVLFAIYVSQNPTKGKNRFGPAPRK